ncbi:MAG: MFS transporter [Spirochaetia bacterium]|nr:MFS transporter [Spirochaetia bacterium]
MEKFNKDIQFWKFSFYGFVKNLRFFDPYLILFFREVGISYFEIGILFGIREIATNILEIPSGIIADSYGRRRSMMAAFVAYIFSFLVFYFFPAFVPYIGAMLLFALGEAFRTGTHKAMILDYITRQGIADQKVHYYGHTRSWSQRGSALSALLAGLIVFVHGQYHQVFLYSIIPYIIGFLLLKSYPKYLDFSGDTVGAEGGPQPSADASLSDDAVGQKIKRSLRDSVQATLHDFRDLLKYRKLRRLMLNSSLYDGVFKTSKDYIQPIMRNLALGLPVLLALGEEKRVALVVGGLYFILYMLTATVSQRAGKFQSVQYTEKGLNLTYLVSIITVVAVGVSMRYECILIAVVLFIGFYVLQNLRRPMTVGYVSEKIKGTVMATGLSAESQLKTVVVAVASPIFGALVDSVGLGWAMCALAVLPLAAYPFLRVQK